MDARTLAAWVQTDWWDWYFSPGDTGDAPTASPDSYQLNSNASLFVGTDSGLLSNDTDPENNPVVAVLLDEPDYGNVEVAIDGSFVYSPSNGFVGLDQFAYQTSDFGGFSEVQIVLIEVFPTGDFDHDYDVDASDVDALSAAIRNNATELRFDVDLDESVTSADHRFLVENILSTSLGDANLDGIVDTLDYAAWKLNRFTMNTGWAAGDFNGDGVTDGSDLNLWNAYRFEVAAAPSSESRPSARARSPRAASSDVVSSGIESPFTSMSLAKLNRRRRG